MRAVSRALVLTLLLSFPSLSAQAADPPGEVALGTLAATERFNELRQSVAPLPGGSSAVVWESRGSGNGDVHLQIVGPDGGKVLGPHGALVAGTGLYENDAVVAASPEGTVFVAWKESVGGDSLVRVQAYDGTGQVLWAAGGVLAANVSREYQDTPNLVAGPDGGVYVCLQGVGSTDDVKIRCNLLDAGGHPLWSEAGQETGGVPGWRSLPKAVSDGAGGLLVFWRNGRGIDDDVIDLDLLEGQRFAPDGTPLWGPQGKVVRTTNQPERSGAGYTGHLVVPDGRGGAVLAFTDSSGNPDWGLDVYAQRVNASGEILWGARAVVRSGKVDKQLSELIAAPDGGAFVVVSDFLGGSSVRSRVFRLSPAGGKHLWTRKGVLLNDRGLQDYGAFGSFDGGVLRIAWIHQTQLGFFFDVNLAAFDLTGKRLTPAKGIPITRARDAQFLRGFVFDPERGQGFAVWNDRRKGNFDLMDTYGGFYTEGKTP